MAQAISSSNGSEVEVLASIRLPYPSRRLPAARPPGATLSRRVPRARAAVVEDRPAITDQDGFDLGMLAHDTADRRNGLCAVGELGLGQQIQSASHVPAHEVAGNECCPFQNERELARGLAPLHFKHAETGDGLSAIPEPALTREGKGLASGARARQ